ncbi:hypothetical protein I3F58_11205 [Streptomyces sp. MUM 203J]|uniref:hypothetical protein n=1 Tax=Streptomyces sp. MUM 203J TaxID=2791990 RepID=UPI001F03F5D6|nr:hypothetical protein [Streptomyces sp. MUM 203J]MCH0540126.1 hypothetical protein [Streptomyces sp. MUM 203J]
MKKSTLRSAVVAAALAGGLASTAFAAPAASAAPPEARSTAVERITTAEQLARSLEQAVAREESRGGTVAQGNPVGFIASPQSNGTLC